MKNRVSEWEEAKIVCIAATETSEKSYIVDCVIYFADHYTGSGFGGLEVACWPLVPKFAGSNPDF